VELGGVFGDALHVKTASIWGCTRAGMDVQACRADSPYFFTNAVTVSGDIGL